MTTDVHDPTDTTQSADTFRDRVVLPFAMPVATLVVIMAFVGAMALLLTWVGTDVAVALAIVLAADILAVAAFVASRPPSPVTTKLAAAMGVAILLAGGGAAVAMTTESGAPEALPGAPDRPAAPEGLRVVAEDIAFDTDQINLDAGEEAVIVFENRDAGVPHNIAIYTDSTTSEGIFTPELFNGVATRTYEFTAPEAGEYHFVCDAHPGMNGTVTVE